MSVGCKQEDPFVCFVFYGVFRGEILRKCGEIKSRIHHKVFTPNQ